MKVFFTGATGVLGRKAVPKVLEAGHEVTAVSRNEGDSSWLEAVGARPVQVDLFDEESVSDAISGSDAIVHFATAIPPLARMPKREAWNMNDRLRDEATGILVDAAIARDVSGFVQESITFFYGDGGDSWLDEAAPIAPSWEVLDSALAAEKHVQRFREAGGTGVVLRLARLYGPGPASAEYIEAVKGRRIPIVAGGANYVSSLHVEDAGNAVKAALAAAGGIYNVADDEPVAAAEYVMSLAHELGAPDPRRVPGWLARLAAGRVVGLLTTSQRVDNRSFKEATGWAPGYPSVIHGWRELVKGSAISRGG